MQFKKATTKSLAYKVWNRANRQHPDDCWEWMGHIGRTGYGILKHEGRQAKGERGGRAKLTEKQVIEIRQRQSNGEKIASLSREFGVSWTAIKFVVNGTNWRCV